MSLEFKEKFKSIGWALLSGIITSCLLGAWGYQFVIKENEINIKWLEKEIVKQNQRIEKLDECLCDYRGRIEKLRLCVLSAHPDKFEVTLTSVEKIKVMDFQELGLLIKATEMFVQSPDDGYDKVMGVAEFRSLIEKADLRSDDFKAYSQALGFEFVKCNVEERGNMKCDPSLQKGAVYKKLNDSTPAP